MRGSVSTTDCPIAPRGYGRLTEGMTVRGYRVLVAYATDNGGTSRIAQAIRRALVRQGAEVDVSGAAFARRVDRYDAIVLGSPHRRGSWHPDAKQFLRRHRRGLSTRPVWLFQIAPALGDDPQRLPADVMRHARRIGAVGILNLMPPIGHAAGDADTTAAEDLTNIDAIEPLASLVIATLERRRAV